METAPHSATDEVISLYLGAGAYLDEDTTKAFQAHVLEHYGLKKLELVRPEATPED